MLPPHHPIDNAIHLEPGFVIPYRQIYNRTEVKLRTLKEYIQTNIAHGFIQRLSSSSEALIVFAMKKDGGQRLCVDSRQLNSLIVTVRGSLLAAIMILDYGYKMHTYPRYAQHLCMYYSSGQQHPL